jgi:hypothetical protein
MSGRNIFKSPMLKFGMIIGASVAALTLGACASSGSSSSRYGSVYDYESGGSCGGSCGAVVSQPAAPIHRSTTVIGGQPVSPGLVYTDCSQIAAVGCGAPYAPPVPAPAPVYTAPVGCPIDTTMASDGTCVMTTTSSSSWSTSSTSSVSCPSHTTQASDGTCMITETKPTVTVYPTTGYVPPVNYTAPVYQPIRK